MSVVLDIDEFRTLFPAFADDMTYPDSTITQVFAIASCYVSTDSCNSRMSGDCRKQAVYLMLAHLLALSDIINAGDSPGSVVSATVGSVSVSLKPSPDGPQWQWWANQTPYGQQYLALLQAFSTFGFYVGGCPERKAFRGFAGRFGCG